MLSKIYTLFRLKKTCILLFLFFLCTRVAPAELFPSFVINSYTVKNGLSHNTIWCALQDSYGFIWFGTDNGLNCFDGQRNTIFRTSSQNKKQSLGSNFIYSLFEDKQRRIWIGTDRGIYIYDRKNTFIPFTQMTKFGVSISSEVRKIIQLSDEEIAIATLGQGIFIYNLKNDTLTQNNQYLSFVWDMYVDRNHKLYIASLQEGIICLDKGQKFIQSFPLQTKEQTKNFLKTNCILPIGKSLWIGTDSKFLFEINTLTGKVDCRKLQSDQFQIVQCLIPFTKDTFLIGTDNGIYLYNYKDQTLSNLTEIHNNDGTNITDQNINAFIKDKEGGIWALTNQTGAIHIIPKNKTFNLHKIPGNPTVNAFYEDHKRHIVWVGTQKGLFTYNTTSNDIQEYPLVEKEKQLYDIRCLCLKEDELWIGTFSNGLKVLNLTNGKIRTYQHSYNIPNTICSNNIQKIYKCHDGTIYIGTNWGLCYYNPEEDNFRTETSVGAMISITDIYEDSHNNLWITTANNGIFFNNKNANYWKHYEHKQGVESSLINNSIITLFEDSNKKIWLGTNGNGLCLFNAEAETFTTFTNKQLSTLVVYSIEEDFYGYLWLTSNIGLIRVNPKNFDDYQYFTNSDGLQENLFCERASHKISDGTLLFGGTNGFNSFQPSFVQKNTFIPPVYITDFILTHSDSSQDTQELLNLEEPIFLTKQIKLPYNNNSFSIYFASLSYQNPQKNHFSYKLEGIDTEWNSNIRENFATYHNLPPGKYCFSVKGSNNDQKWNEQIAKLWIIITPPWYRSVWAYLAYIACAICLIIYVLYKRNFYLKAKYQKRIEEYQIKKDKELYKNKVNFFINLIHEIRTPLTLIKLPLESIMHAAIDKQTEEHYLQVINKNVDYLLGVTNELLDFQKMESGEIKLHLKLCDISQQINSIYQQFAGSADLRNISLSIHQPEDFHLEALVDGDKLNRILVNLLSNAMKYANNVISITVKNDAKEFSIIVEDDGPGIADAEKEKIFQNFYQVADGQSIQGTGIGLAYSRALAESHHGTLHVENSSLGGSAFILTLPIYNEDLQKEENKGIILPDSRSHTDLEGSNDKPASSSKAKILLVEDNRDLLELECNGLKEYYHILKAQNGIEALQIMKDEDVDIVVTDVMMPLMNGFELCHKIKSNIEYSHIPVILLTAKTLPESKEEGFSYGADSYIEKPFTIQQLHMQIRNLLNLRTAFQKRMASFFPQATPEEKDKEDYIPFTAQDQEFIKKIQEIIELQLNDENFSIDVLATEMHMSRSNFYRKLKALSGMSPNDYLKNCRLNKAAQLLKEGYRVTEVFERTGFGSSSYFAKCFKAKFGVLPKDYTESLN